MYNLSYFDEYNTCVVKLDSKPWNKKAPISRGYTSSEGGNRTPDLRVMNPAL